MCRHSVDSVKHEYVRSFEQEQIGNYADYSWALVPLCDSWLTSLLDLYVDRQSVTDSPREMP